MRNKKKMINEELDMQQALAALSPILQSLASVKTGMSVLSRELERDIVSVQKLSNRLSGTMTELQNSYMLFGSFYQQYRLFCEQLDMYDQVEETVLPTTFSINQTVYPVDRFMGLDSQQLHPIINNVVFQLDQFVATVQTNMKNIIDMFGNLIDLSERFDNEQDVGHKLDIKKEIRTILGTNQPYVMFLIVNDKYDVIDSALSVLSGLIACLTAKGLTSF